MSSRGAPYRKHVWMARVEGGALGIGGIVTAAPDLVSLIWIQSRMVFYIAAAHGYDPNHPMRPAELLALLDLYATPAEARLALDGVGKHIAQAVAEQALRGRDDHALHIRLARYLGRRLARRAAGRLVPFIGAPIGALQNGGVTQSLGRRALAYYGGIRPGRRPAPRRRSLAPTRPRPGSGPPSRSPPAATHFDWSASGCGLAVRRRVDHARQDRVAAHAVVAVLGVERLDEREHGGLGDDVAARRRRTAAAPARAETTRRRRRRAARGAASPRGRAGRPAAGSARIIARTRRRLGLVDARPLGEAADQVHHGASRSSTAAPRPPPPPSGSKRSALTRLASPELLSSRSRSRSTSQVRRHLVARRRSSSRDHRGAERSGSTGDEHGHVRSPGRGRPHCCGT